MNNDNQQTNNNTNEHNHEEKKDEQEPIEEQKTEEKEVNVDYKDKYLRAYADYQNLVRETNERRAEWAQLSEIQVLEAFIPVYDNFKKAAAHQPQEESNVWKNWGMGVGFIEKQFGEVLKRFGIEEIETVGKQFDPNVHEAVEEEIQENCEEGVIVREIESGYKKANKVIKPAKVVVCKKG